MTTRHTVPARGSISPDRCRWNSSGPVWLAIGLFIAIPGLYAALLTLLAERWIQPDGWWARSPTPLALAPLALWLPVAPLLGVLLVAWAVREALVGTSPGAAAPGHPALRWAARSGLAFAFVLGLVDLVRDAAELT